MADKKFWEDFPSSDFNDDLILMVGDPNDATNLKRITVALLRSGLASLQILTDKYYQKTETYTKNEIKSLIEGVGNFNFLLVSELPKQGENGKIYLLKNSESTDTKNIYSEYLWIDDIQNYERLGSINADFDLSNYVTNDGLTKILANYVSSNYFEQYKTSTSADIDKKVDKIEGKGLSSNDYINDDKAKVDLIAKDTSNNVTFPASVNSTENVNFDATVEPTQTGNVSKSSQWLWQYFAQSINYFENNSIGRLKIGDNFCQECDKINNDYIGLGRCIINGNGLYGLLISFKNKQYSERCQLFLSTPNSIDSGLYIRFHNGTNWPKMTKVLTDTDINVSNYTWYGKTLFSLGQIDFINNIYVTYNGTVDGVADFINSTTFTTANRIHNIYLYLPANNKMIPKWPGCLSNIEITEALQDVVVKLEVKIINGNTLVNSTIISKANKNKYPIISQDFGDDENKAISQKTISIAIKNIMEDNLYCGYERDVTDSQAEVRRIAGAGQMDFFFADGGGIFNNLKGCLIDEKLQKTYLNSTDWSNEILDGSLGNVFVEIPKLFVKYETEGNKIRFKCSLYPLSGFTAFHGGKNVYVGAYKGVVDRTLASASQKLRSICNPAIIGGDASSTYAWGLGGRAATDFSLTQYRALARANGANYFIQDWNTRNLLYNLFIAEYGTLNSQAPVQARDPQTGYCRGGLGNGVTNITDWENYNGYRPIVPCGASNSLGNGSGEVAYNVLNQDGTTKQTVYVPRFHGIENPFGDVWEFIDGVHLMCQSDADGGKILVYANDDISTFQDTDNINYEKRGEAIQTNGYVSKMLWGDKGDMIATEVNGGSSTYYCDYFYIDKPSSGTQLRAGLVGGIAHVGGFAGLGCVYANYVPADAYVFIGSRLCYLGSEND